MTQRILYRPQVSQGHLQSFDQRLSQCPGTWTVTRSFVHAGDPRVLRLRWIDPGVQWSDIPGYLDFLDVYQHRALLHCFTRQSQKQTWSMDELQQKMKPQLSHDELGIALSFCEQQEFLLTRGTSWQPGPAMMPIANFGATFEWLVMENLQRFFQCLARRSVHFKELQEQQLGDLDVLAFHTTGLVMSIECKSRSSGIERGHVMRFLQRAALFPSDIALLLIDTPREQHITSRLTQITSCLPTFNKEQMKRYDEGGCLLYHIQKNLYVANTGKSIRAMLDLLFRAVAPKHS